MTAATPGPARSPGRPEQREALLAGLLEHVLREGVATLSLRPLAAALGTSDRMLLYYFGTRDGLLVAVLGAVGEQLQTGLAAALPGDPVPPARLLADAWAALQAPEVEAHLRLYMEISGLAVRDREPFRSVVAQVAEGWLQWVAQRLDVPPDQRQAAAAGVLALVDGLLLTRFATCPGQADQASAWLVDALDRAPSAQVTPAPSPPRG